MVKKYGLTAREYEIMDFLWDCECKITFKDLMKYFNEKEEMKKQTLSTFLKKLINDGLVKADETEKKYLYYSAISRDEHIHQWTNELVADCFNNSIGKFLVAFSGNTKLNAEEADELKRYLAKYEEE